MTRLYELWVRGPFSEVFLAEYSRLMINERVCALPENERIYFLGTVDNSKYLIGVRVFPQSIDISSIGKISEYDPTLSGKTITKDSKSVRCLRELIQDHLVPLAEKLQKDGVDGEKRCIIAFTLPTTDGARLFQALIESHRDSPVKGISECPYSTYENHEFIMKLS